MLLSNIRAAGESSHFWETFYQRNGRPPEKCVLCLCHPTESTYTHTQTQQLVHPWLTQFSLVHFPHVTQSRLGYLRLSAGGFCSGNGGVMLSYISWLDFRPLFSFSLPCLVHCLLLLLFLLLVFFCSLRWWGRGKEKEEWKPHDQLVRRRTGSACGQKLEADQLYIMH